MPTSGSWLNIVEIFFRIIIRQAIRCGTLPPWQNSSLRPVASSTVGTNAASHSSEPRTLPPIRTNQLSNYFYMRR